MLNIYCCLRLVHWSAADNMLILKQLPASVGMTAVSKLWDICMCFVIFSAIRMAEKFVKTNMFKTLGAKLLDRVLPSCLHHSAGSDGYWECYVRHMAFPLIQRLAGTCRMGPADSINAVVDEQLRYGTTFV